MVKSIKFSQASLFQLNCHSVSIKLKTKQLNSKLYIAAERTEIAINVRTDENGNGASNILKINSVTSSR